LRGLGGRSSTAYASSKRDRLAGNFALEWSQNELVLGRGVQDIKSYSEAMNKSPRAHERIE
jgi:hypothetical protein